ncbi:MAG: GFA family protein [Beijerinckiaceae bacterium]
MTTKLTGGCACGAVRYACDDEPIVQVVCHCRDCQKASGSSHAAILFVPSDRLTFSGTGLKYHEVTGASGRRLQRGHCPECGSPVAGRWPENNVYELIQVGSLDDPSGFAPTVECWMSSAAAWHPTFEGTTRYEEGPTPAVMRERIKAYFAARS